MRRPPGARKAAAACLAGALAVLPASPAQAHFVLQSPASWMSQDIDGLPEKLGPCGDEEDGTDASTPTGTVTTVQQGQTITVTINEVIFHPGHYRIALAVGDRSELPAEPPVTTADTPCGSAAIQNPPVFPVLADDVFDHTAPFTSPQSVQITLPPDVTCTKCTLQVIEFMSEHPLNDPGGCFYHHCADLSIQAASPGRDASGGGPGRAGGPGAEDAGVSATTEGGADGGSGGNASSSGCALGSSPATSSAWVLALGAGLGFARKRRRKAP